MKCSLPLQQLFFLLSLAICVYSRSHGHHSGWRPGHARHRYSSDLIWDPDLRKRDPFYLYPSDSLECCPSTMEIIQPLGGVSKSGRILELYRDQNSTQSFYQSSCKDGIKGRPCRYIDDVRRKHSVCVQRYTYTYALVREFNSQREFRLDYIRVRSGCSCEIRLKKNHANGRRLKWIGDFI